MTALGSQDVLRPGPQGLRRWLVKQVGAAIPLGFRLLRRVRPIARLGSTYVVTLHDDVREVFSTEAAFHVPYKPNLDVITGGEPFFLGTDDPSEHRTGVETMRRVVRADDLPTLWSAP
jgi:hypothetical protein